MLPLYRSYSNCLLVNITRQGRV